jgi:ABC-2 type transport system ATP-binding protein
VETDERPMVVSMLLGGRIRPDAGSVEVDGTTDLTTLRHRTALVDTPFVAEPAPGVSLGIVVSEEFSFSKRAGGAKQVRAFLAEHDLADYTGIEVRALPPAARVRIFSELALLRDGVDTLILTSPERHGGDPREWFDSLSTIADRGIGVVIVTDAPTRDRLLSLGARDATATLES